MPLRETVPLQGSIYNSGHRLDAGTRLEGIPVVFIEEHGELLHGYPKIGLVEFVGDVPANGPVQPPLLDKSMEKAQPEQQFPELSTYLNQAKPQIRWRYS